MIIFFAILLTVATFAFVTYPLFRQRLRPADSTEDERLAELHSKKDTSYSMLKELEFDFQSGILSKEDYHDLDGRYKKRAISILKEIDDAEKGVGVEDEIEKQVARLRQKAEIEKQVVEPRQKDEIENEVMKLRQKKANFCPRCGTRVQEGDRFCSHCGTNLVRRGSS